MKKKRRIQKELRVGGLIILALAIMIGAVFSIGGQRKLFGGKVKYHILFNTTGGLYEGDPVLLTGVEVGNVTRIGFSDDLGEKKIMVGISILKELRERIREDTRARIGSASLIYGKVVELTMGSEDRPVIPEGGRIEALDITNYSAIVDSTNLMVDDVREVLTKINRGEGMLGLILNEPMGIRQTIENLAVSSQRLASLLEKLDKGTGPLGSVLSDTLEFHETLKDMKKAVSDVEEITKNLKNKETFFGKLINDTQYGKEVSGDLKSVMHSLASITAKIDSGQGTIGSLINDKALYYGMENVVLGVEKSSIARWLIQGRRKAGEKERNRTGEEKEEP